MIKTYFRISSYAVISTRSSVIYFGGLESNGVNPWDEDADEESDKVVEYKNLKWTQLGKLASPRRDHRSIKIQNKIYLLGGWGKT